VTTRFNDTTKRIDPDSQPLNTGDSGKAFIPITKFVVGSRNAYENWGWNSLKYHVQNHTRTLFGQSRHERCLRQIAPLQEFVNVHVKNKKAHYRNLYRCGSVWLCPCCADTITNRRRNEVASVFASLKMNVYMVTFTMRHNRGQSLKLLTDVMTDSFREMRQRTGFRRQLAYFDLKHFIKSLEVTVGNHGWHPHMHVAYFSPSLIDPEELQTEFFYHWKKALHKHDFDVRMSGFDVTEGDATLSEYLAKWGHHKQGVTWQVEDEITRQPIKQGKNSLSPMDLMKAYANPLLDSGDHRLLAALLHEYAEGTYRKHHIQFSTGLKKQFELLPNEQIVKQEAQEYPLLARLYPDDWNAIIRTNSRGKVLEIASENDAQKLFDFIDTLRR